MDLVNHIVLQPSGRMIRVDKGARHITVDGRFKSGKEASPKLVAKSYRKYRRYVIGRCKGSKN